MPRLLNTLTGKDAGYVTNEQWDAMKGDRRYKVFQAQPGLDDLPEVQALQQQQRQEAKAEQVQRRTRKKVAQPEEPESPPEETPADEENAES